MGAKFDILSTTVTVADKVVVKFNRRHRNVSCISHSLNADDQFGNFYEILHLESDYKHFKGSQL